MKTLLYLLFSFFSVYCNAQSTVELLAFADKQFEIKNFDEAEYVYQRVIFFDSTDLKTKAYKKLGDLTFNKGDFEQAGIYYDVAYSNETVDSTKNSISLKKAFCLILEEKPQLALVELFSREDTLLAEKRNFYFALAYFQAGNLDFSKEYFLKTVKDDPAMVREVEELFRRYNKKKPKSSSKARTLSTIIPGLGQLYAGDIKNAVNSGLLTAGLTVLFIYTGINYGYLDAILSVFPWLQRYYFGGIKKAGIIATDKERKRKEILYNKLLLTAAHP